MGDGTLQFVRNVGTGGRSAQQLSLEDRNGDGIPDLSVVNNVRGSATNTNNFTIRLGNGDLTFGDRNTFDIPNDPFGFDFGDVNGDGLEDLTVARERSSNAAVMLADGQGGFTFTETPIGPGSLDAALADFNGDGFPDYVVGTTTNVRVAFGDGTGTFANRQTISSAASRYQAVEVADLNNDGRADILATSRGSLHVFRNLGGGRFIEEAIATRAGAARHADIAVADLDHDGFLDVMVPNGFRRTVVAFYNEGAGRFSTASRRTFLAGTTTLSVALGDLNGDGDLEAVVGNESSAPVIGALTVLEGIGDGTFNQFRERGLPGLKPQSVELADVNRDGILDLVSIAGGSVNNSLAVQFGDGSGSLAAPIDIPFMITALVPSHPLRIKERFAVLALVLKNRNPNLSVLRFKNRFCVVCIHVHSSLNPLRQSSRASRRVSMRLISSADMRNLPLSRSFSASISPFAQSRLMYQGDRFSRSAASLVV